MEEKKQREWIEYLSEYAADEIDRRYYVKFVESDLKELCRILCSDDIEKMRLFIKLMLTLKTEHNCKVHSRRLYIGFWLAYRFLTLKEKGYTNKQISWKIIRDIKLTINNIAGIPEFDMEEEALRTVMLSLCKAGIGEDKPKKKRQLTNDFVSEEDIKDMIRRM